MPSLNKAHIMLTTPLELGHWLQGKYHVQAESGNTATHVPLSVGARLGLNSELRGNNEGQAPLEQEVAVVLTD